MRGLRGDSGREVLPRRARLRLWCTGKVDDAAYWLITHDKPELAILVWKLTRLWK